jgi:hypothetical protein
MVQRLVVDLSLWRSAFDPRPVFVEFVTDRGGNFFGRIIEISPVIIVLQML